MTILIKDVNDEVPVFISANETAIMENVAINTVVIAVKAVDNDEGRNGYIDYLMKEARDEDMGQSDPLPFSLNPTDGQLRVVDALDRGALKLFAKHHSPRSWRATPVHGVAVAHSNSGRERQ